MIRPEFRVKFRKNPKNKFSIGIPIEIARQIENCEYLLLEVDQGKIIITPAREGVKWKS